MFFFFCRLVKRFLWLFVQKKDLWNLLKNISPGSADSYEVIVIKVCKVEQFSKQIIKLQFIVNSIKQCKVFLCLRIKKVAGLLLPHSNGASGKTRYLSIMINK